MRFEYLRTRRLRGAVALLIGALLSGCAYRYEDAAGRQHVVGLVHLTLVSAAADRTLAGDVVGLQTVGALVENHDGETTFAFGYAKRSTASIRDNALVLGSPGQRLDAILEGQTP